MAEAWLSVCCGVLHVDVAETGGGQHEPVASGGRTGGSSPASGAAARAARRGNRRLTRNESRYHSDNKNNIYAETNLKRQCRPTLNAGNICS
ncbi:unnamed protein product [Acanthoscelides obtectus]|uniref:Uncharacterized protein n=1 Tax=Acanthoscelides obtectus TaxID=200917 RepID=A0A9P0QAI5_ACAOB|nr:unnamed protein product [Acanthoscelides obtectus]CAK1675899.1 hypothetical protein AOBTE_LOCUS30476 [Acanthoscelides obtectus]